MASWIRRAVKTAAAAALSWTGVPTLLSRPHTQPFVICYHRIVERLDANDGCSLPAMETTVATLEQHLDWLAKHFRIVSLDELGDAPPSPARSARRLAAVTFDDGYRDVYDHAFPLLKRKGIPAAIFVVADLIDTNQVPAHERLYRLLANQKRPSQGRLAGSLRAAGVTRNGEGHLPAAHHPFNVTRFLLARLSQAEIHRVMAQLETDVRGETGPTADLRPMTWGMLVEVRRAGMTIGSHTKTHAFLTNETQDQVALEVSGSRLELGRRLETDIRHFAYPGGCFNADVVQAVAGAGYRLAFTICRHRDPLFPHLTIPRTVLWERASVDCFGRFSPAMLSCHAAGLLPWGFACRHAAPRTRHWQLVTRNS